MTTAAIVMLIVALFTVWGGLVLALVNLRRSPQEHDPEEGAENVDDSVRSM
ncbi:MAG: methionine/alanine import family NSS transporter small subunit [Actinomycetota bacterium]